MEIMKNYLPARHAWDLPGQRSKQYMIITLMGFTFREWISQAEQDERNFSV